MGIVWSILKICVVILGIVLGLHVLAVVGVFAFAGIKDHAPAAATRTAPTGGELISGNCTYTVQRGDTLSQIASRTGCTVGQLARLNALTDQNRITEGQVLKVPAGS